MAEVIQEQIQTFQSGLSIFLLLLPILPSLFVHRQSFEAVWADLLGDILGTVLYLDEAPFLHLQRLQPRDLYSDPLSSFLLLLLIFFRIFTTL